jgi:hypothetical protein
MPIGGTVYHTALIGPLIVDANTDASVLEFIALADLVPDEDGVYLPEGTQMHTAIWVGDDGFVVGFTHVRGDVITGRAEAGEVFAYVSISGIESMANLLAAHIHLAVGNRSTMPPGWNGMMGDIPARNFFGHYGFQVELREVNQECSPMHYQQNRCYAGVIR